MNWVLPGLIMALLACAYIKGTDVYSAFIQGAAEALTAIVKILPCMGAMMAAIGVFRESGCMDALVRLAAPVWERLGMPAELAPLFMLRPFSGSAAMALLQDVYQTCGVDSSAGYAASIMLGSTETIFYTVSLYLGSIGVTKPGYGVPAALIAGAAGAAAALVLTGIKGV